MYIVCIRPDMWLCKTFDGHWMGTYVRENAFRFPSENEARSAASNYCQGLVEFDTQEVHMYRCVAKCLELDCNNITHCKAVNLDEVYERWPDGCPCGNDPKWVEEEYTGVKGESV